jgi:peptide-methionine (S)-S-oxide reductase
MEKNLITATFAGGCFWCLEAVYDQVKGVHSVESGYAGGHVDNPTYRDVCNGTTGHAEVVQVHYDGNVVSYQDLLTIFFGIHDPTTLNRQGADVGTQYRSAIFYHNEEQKDIAEKFIKDMEMQKVFDNPIVTQVVPLDKFYMAEDYHQEYFAKNPYQGYCMAVVSPKVSKFRKHFQDLLKKEAV